MFTVYLCIMCGRNGLIVPAVVTLYRVTCRTVHFVGGSTFNHISPNIPLPYSKKHWNNSMVEEPSHVK